MFLSRMSPAPGAQAMRAFTTYAHHQQIWRFFPEDKDSSRDFLYRYDMMREGPQFYAVSARAPATDAGGWRVESRPYAPDLEAGASLRFSLRANPTKRFAKPGERSDGRRHDVVMDRKRQLRASGQDVDEASLVQEEGIRWLARQGDRGGFDLVPGAVRASGYRSYRFQKAGGTEELAITGIEFEGALTVIDPERFQRTLLEGVGPAKGFGFGLLLVRRP